MIATYSGNNPDVQGTTTEVFDFAISTMGGLLPSTSGTIYVSAGDYIYSGKKTTVPANVEIIFDKGAWIKWDTARPWNSIFAVSGTITNPNLDITTSIVIPLGNPGYAIFDMWGGGKVRGGEGKLFFNMVSLNDYSPLIANFGPLSRNAEVSNFTVSTFSIVQTANSPQSMTMFGIDGSTGGSIINFRTKSKSETAGASIGILNVESCDGFLISGGDWEWNGNTVATIGGFSDTGEMIRGFKWIDTNIRLKTDATTSGSIDISPTTAVLISSGNAIDNLNIIYDVATTNPLIRFSAPALAFGAITISNNRIFHNTPGSSGGGFLVDGGGVVNLLFMNNSIWGTTGCMSDSGTGTKWAGNENYCQGNEQ